MPQLTHKKRPRLALVLAASAITTAFALPNSTVDAQNAAPTPTPKSLTVASSVCSTDGIAALLTAKDDGFARIVITARLAQCKRDLDPKGTNTRLCPVPTPVPAGAADKPGLADAFNLLEACAVAESPPSAPASALYVSHVPTFYVIVQGATDQTAVNSVLRNVVDELHKAVANPLPIVMPTPAPSPENVPNAFPTLPPGGAMDTFQDSTLIVAHADWAIKDFVAQCVADPSVRGALVIDGLLDQSATETYIVWQNGWTRLNAEAELISCLHAPSGTAPRQPELVAVQHNIEGAGYRNGFPFTVASSVASLFASRYGSVAASPTPISSPNGLQVLQSTSPALLLATVGSGLSSVVVPTLNGASEMNHASLTFALSIMNELNRQCVTGKLYANSANVKEQQQQDRAGLNQTINDLEQLCLPMHDFEAVVGTKPYFRVNTKTK